MTLHTKLQRRERADHLSIPSSHTSRSQPQTQTFPNRANSRSDFLLFIPVSSPNLGAVFSYFTTSTRMNPEGDVLISEDIIDGLGITAPFLYFLFGTIIRIAKPPQPDRSSSQSPPTAFPAGDVEDGEEDVDVAITMQALPPQESIGAVEREWKRPKKVALVLMSFVPYSGYFVAGGLSGIVSRTATAPLDRLKVFLIAQTGSAQDAVDAAKSGNPVRAFKHGYNTLANATKELWRAGGMRSLYAGRCFETSLAVALC
jgi:solute carrier family 25 (mitochondrial phosphate transporter), member 23/24/25/41